MRNTNSKRKILEIPTCRNANTSRKIPAINAAANAYESGRTIIRHNNVTNTNGMDVTVPWKSTAAIRISVRTTVILVMDFSG